MDWTLSIKDEDGFVIFEADAVIEFSVEWDDMGFPEIDVDGFTIETSKPNQSGSHWVKGKQPAYFCADSDKLWMKHLFFHVKEDLENDDSFTAWAAEQAEACYPRARARLPMNLF